MSANEMSNQNTSRSEKEFPDPRDDEQKGVVDVSGDDETKRRFLKVVAWP